MPEAYSVLGQIAPLVSTLTDVYTVPASTEAVISTIIICNTGGTSSKVRLSIAINGAASIPQQFLLFDKSVPKNDTLSMTIGVTLDASDVIRVFADKVDIAFNVFGAEITP